MWILSHLEMVAKGTELELGDTYNITDIYNIFIDYQKLSRSLTY